MRNWLWEMAQMFAYTEMTRLPWQQTVLTCTLATCGDVLATLFVYGLISLVRRDVRWGFHSNGTDYAWAAAFGAAIAVSIEKTAIIFRQWSYTDVMPIVPVLDVGLLPFLQLALLIPLTLWGAARFSGNQFRR
jgi:hypothetical protein